MLEQKQTSLVDDEEALERWAKRYRASRERAGRTGFVPPAETLSGLPVEALYTPSSLHGEDYAQQIGYPGEFP
jgi:hypothetical protein